jgi:hypothetical protein
VTGPEPVRSATLTTTHLVSRLGAGIVGAYVFTWGFIAVLAGSLLKLGVAFHEATDLAWLLGLLVYLVSFCFAFISSSLPHVWLLLGGGGALMTLTGWWLARATG